MLFLSSYNSHNLEGSASCRRLTQWGEGCVGCVLVRIAFIIICALFSTFDLWLLFMLLLLDVSVAALMSPAS